MRTCDDWARARVSTPFAHGPPLCVTGVTLYTLVTGRLPFRSDDPVEMFDLIREAK